MMIRQLLQGTSPEVEGILGNLSLTFIPCANPDGPMYREDATGDGHEQRVSRRQNTQPWCACESRYEPYYIYGNPFIDAETSARSLRLNQLVGEALSDQPWDAFDTVTRYGYFPIWGDYFDALCPLTDAAAMLYEVSGQSDQVGNESYGLYLEATRIGYMETFRALAEDPQLGDVDEEAYFETPLAGPEIEDADRASLEGFGQTSGVALPR